MSPYVGMGLTTFVTQKNAGEQAFSNVRAPEVNVWVFGGIQGRFDLFGSKRPSIALASSD